MTTDLIVLCPHCGATLDCTCSTDPRTPDEVPGPGDVSLCAECAELLVFTPTMGTRQLSESEWAGMPEDQRAYLSALQRWTRTVNIVSDRLRRGLSPDPRPIH